MKRVARSGLPWQLYCLDTCGTACLAAIHRLERRRAVSGRSEPAALRLRVSARSQRHWQVGGWGPTSAWEPKRYCRYSESGRRHRARASGRCARCQCCRYRGTAAACAGDAVDRRDRMLPGLLSFKPEAGPVPHRLPARDVGAFRRRGERRFTPRFGTLVGRAGAWTKLSSARCKSDGDQNQHAVAFLRRGVSRIPVTMG